MIQIIIQPASRDPLVTAALLVALADRVDSGEISLTPGVFSPTYRGLPAGTVTLKEVP